MYIEEQNKINKNFKKYYVSAYALVVRLENGK